MNKLLLYTSISAGLLFATACKKFLDKNPDNRASINSPEQLAQLLSTAYPQSNYMAFCESISDNVGDKGLGDQNVRTINDPYFFRDVSDREQDSPEHYWFACYKAIAVANTALDIISKAADTASYRAQKGEALVARAYAHFMLVTLFSKPYDQATAGSDPGIPYVTEPETVVMKNYARRTVAYVYQQIEKDLLEGLPLIDDIKYAVPRYHFNKSAANAFAARFFLFKKDYPKVIEHATAVLGTGNYTPLLRPWNTVYKQWTYIELFNNYAKATEPANLLLVEAPSWWGRYYFTARYGWTRAKRDEMWSNVTTGTWAFDNQTLISGSDQLHILLPKWNEYFVRNSLNAEIGVGYLMLPLFTTEEVLFNRAEALNEQGNSSAAIIELNNYASTRIDNYNPTTHRIDATRLSSRYGGNTQSNVLKCILDFKRVEYLHEGLRWFDLLRHKLPVVHQHFIRDNVFRNDTLTKDNPYRQFQLPQSVTTSDIPLNPR
jgi:starch-binding outer membrane protein, SusD/RagB family